MLLESRFLKTKDTLCTHFRECAYAPLAFVSMQSAVPQNRERWLLIEKEGRIISSVVAIVSIVLSRFSILGASNLLALSNVIDLVRASYKDHNVGPSIVVHHCVVLVLATA